MTGAEVKAIRLAAGLNKMQFARVVGYTATCVAVWERTGVRKERAVSALRTAERRLLGVGGPTDGDRCTADDLMRLEAARVEAQARLELEHRALTEQVQAMRDRRYGYREDAA